jgi:hypothetical protein
MCIFCASQHAHLSSIDDFPSQALLLVLSARNNAHETHYIQSSININKYPLNKYNRLFMQLIIQNLIYASFNTL